MKHITRLIAIGLAVLTLTACSSDGEEASTSTEAAGATVTIAQFDFKPGEIEVLAGTTVTWENTDRILHTATAGTPENPTGVFDGVMTDQGESYQFTFTEPGTYSYFCSRHNHMTGTVVVTG